MTTFNDQPFSKFGKRVPVGIIGAPSDLGASTSGGGQALAPRGIRLSAHYKRLSNTSDLGDVQVQHRSLHRYLDHLEEEVRAAFTDTQHLVVIGGDDSISLAVVRAAHSYLRGYTLIHFDAHEDREDSVQGLDHSSWLDHALGERVVPAVYQSEARSLGMRKGQGVPLPRYEGQVIDGPVVVVLDMDWINPAFAPGVAVAEPGGPSSGEAIDMFRALFNQHNVVAFVVTEVCPAHDVNEMTQRLAFRLIYDYACSYL